MVSLAPPAGRILLELEYFTPLERHTIRIHARAIERAPFGPANDLGYLPYSADPAAETSILETLAAFGAMWSAYYASDWQLALRSLWGLGAGRWEQFATQPTWAGVIGALGLVQLPGAATTVRIFRLPSAGFMRRRLWLRQLPAGFVQQERPVTPSSGGMDARDQALLAYLTASSTALTAPDGTQFVAPAAVRNWWDRPRAFPWTADALA